MWGNKARVFPYFLNIIFLCLFLLTFENNQLLDIDKILREGKDAYYNGDFNLAIEKLSDVIINADFISTEGKRNQSLAEAHFYIGLCYIAKDDEVSARLHFKQVHILEPNRTLDPNVHAPKVIKIFNESKPIRTIKDERINLYYNTAKELYDKGFYSDALEILEKLLNLDPTHELAIEMKNQLDRNTEKTDIIEKYPKDAKSEPNDKVIDWTANFLQINQTKSQKVDFPLRLLWKREVEGNIIADLLYYRGSIIFSSTNKKVYIINSENGAMQGDIPIRDRGITPIIAAKGNLYFCDASGNIYCLIYNNGNISWKWNQQIEAPIIKPPLFDTQTNTLFVTSYLPPVRGKMNFINAYDANTGAIKWSQQFEQPVTSPLQFYKNNIYFGTLDGNFYRLDKVNGEFEKKFQLDDYSLYPIIFTQDHFFITYYKKKELMRIALNTGLSSFSYKEKSIEDRETAMLNCPLIEGNTIYLAITDGKLKSIDRNTGSERWSFEAKGGIAAIPLLLDKYIFLTTLKGYLQIIDINTGNCMWEYQCGDKIYSSPLFAGNKIYICTYNGHLYSFLTGGE